MAEHAAGRTRRPSGGTEAQGAAGAAPRSPGARWRFLLPRWSRILLAGFSLALVAYGCLWLDLPLRRTLAETVLTSQHHRWARPLGTPAELRAWQNQWARTPDLTVVTQAASSHPVAPVTVTPISGPTYRGWLLTVPDPARIIVGTSRYLGSYGERPSLMAGREGALAAVNGGGFMDPAGEGYGGAPIGVTMSEGRVVPADPDDGSDYVLGFDLQDALVAGKWTIAQARALGIRDAVSFKPLLIVNGHPRITQGDGGWGVGPRTAIGQRADGTVLFVVVDGRQPGSLGATLREVQDVLLRDGAVTAANLDGGSSTVLWKDGQILNHPSSPYGERPVPTAFLVMPAGFDADAQARANLRAQAEVPAVAGPIAPPQPASGPCAPGPDEAAAPGGTSDKSSATVHGPSPASTAPATAVPSASRTGPAKGVAAGGASSPAASPCATAPKPARPATTSGTGRKAAPTLGSEVAPAVSLPGGSVVSASVASASASSPGKRP